MKNKGSGILPEVTHHVSDVFGIQRQLPLNYVERKTVDAAFIDSLSRKKHIVIFGSSKQGKTSLRKHCLKDDDYIVVTCQSKWDLTNLHAAILKAAGFDSKQSEAQSADGRRKLGLSFKVKAGLPTVGEIEIGASGEREKVTAKKTSIDVPFDFEIDAKDTNDVIEALKAIKFDKYIILEDFHYLPVDTQKEFSFALKAFHESSEYTFIIVAVWRDENKLLVYNGDLTNRVIAIDADTWRPEELEEVIHAGEVLLNMKVDEDFKKTLIAKSFESVSIVQEACHNACVESKVLETAKSNIVVGKNLDAQKYISEVVNQSNGRYKSFLENFAAGFQKTQLEMYKWLLYPILTSPPRQLEVGLKQNSVRTAIAKRHPVGDQLNAGNVSQALASIQDLQAKKEIKPFVLDYDQTNSILQVVDKGFLIWLSQQDKNLLLESIGLPTKPDGT